MGKVKGMPTEGGFKFIMPSNDHPPPHVHVIKAEGTFVIVLAPLDQTFIRDCKGVKESDVIKAFHLAAKHYDLLMKEWNQIHA